MKRILFLLSMLWVSMISIFAQVEIEVEKKTVKERLYQEAVEALEQQQFVVTFHAEEWKSRNRIDLDSKRNFLIVDGQKGFFQTSVYSDFSNKNMTGGYGLTPLRMLESDVVKTESTCDKKGNILYTVVLKGGNLVRVKNVKEARITLKKGSNEVVVKLKYKHGDSAVYIGSLHPMDVAVIERGTPYR